MTKKTKKKRPEMEVRVEVTQATLDRWQGRPFDWKGASDCARMAFDHAKRMGDPVPVAKKAGHWDSALGARAALKRQGFKNLPELMDASFERIGWASARIGDFIQMAGEDDTAETEGLGSIGIFLGNQTILVFHELTEGATAAKIIEAKAAWRVKAK